ncbi:site-specific integrase [Boseongicola aestuarii]|uniref:site-specific integrase n=1 Tax=Boseongicola aestuarii TaxID=1470561 RepID=UPI001FE92A39|nr:tyrosine-type recombinase/integrase [Boseongicola aestuarii]
MKKYLHSPKSGYLYVRVRGKYLGRITAPKGSSEFDRQYWDILSGHSDIQERTLTSLIQSYRKSDRWTSLKARTRSDYEKVLVYLKDASPHVEVTDLRRNAILDMMQSNAHRVRFANYIQQVLSVLFEHALDIGWLEANPAKGVRKLRTPEAKKRPHIPWPDAAVEHFREEAHALPRLILEIGIGSVQRPGDWVRFRWSDYDGQSLKVRQGKTGKVLRLPCTETLKHALDSAPKIGLTILTRRDGKPMSYRYLAQIMRYERQRLGLLEFDLHALRYRGVMELAWANCTDDEIAAFSGHASIAMIRKYAGEARQEMLARSAAKKRART